MRKIEKELLEVEIQLIFKSHWNCGEKQWASHPMKRFLFFQRKWKMFKCQSKFLIRIFSFICHSISIPNYFSFSTISLRENRSTQTFTLNQWRWKWTNKRRRRRSSLFSSIGPIWKWKTKYRSKFVCGYWMIINALLILAQLHSEGFHHITFERLINASTLEDIESFLSHGEIDALLINIVKNFLIRENLQWNWIGILISIEIFLLEFEIKIAVQLV